MASTLQRAPSVAAASSYRESVPWTSTVFRLGGIAAAIGAVMTPLSVGFFAASTPPEYDEGAAVWFDHINDNAFLGWMSLDLPFLIVSILMIPVMVALVTALWRVRPASVVVAATLYLVGVATYFGTNTSVELMSLSSRYADATSEASRIALLGAGEGLLAAFDGTAFHVNYILGQVAGIVLGFVMLPSRLFSRKLAFLMIAGNAFGFLLYIPEIGVALSAISGVILWVWMIGVARTLLRRSAVLSRPQTRRNLCDGATQVPTYAPPSVETSGSSAAEMGTVSRGIAAARSRP